MKRQILAYIFIGSACFGENTIIPSYKSMKYQEIYATEKPKNFTNTSNAQEYLNSVHIEAQYKHGEKVLSQYAESILLTVTPAIFTWISNQISKRINGDSSHGMTSALSGLGALAVAGTYGSFFEVFKNIASLERMADVYRKFWPAELDPNDPLLQTECKFLMIAPQLPLPVRRNVAETLYIMRTVENPAQNQVNLDLLDQISRFPTQIQHAQINKTVQEQIALDYPKSRLGKRLSEIARAYAAYLKKNKTSKMPVLFRGGPGTGKTRAAKKVAEMLGLRYCVITLGDNVETLLHGKESHKDITLKALGEIAKCQLETGILNPVLIFDDADRGFGPAHLKVLMRLFEQLNLQFEHHILGTLDVSKMLMLVTANLDFGDPKVVEALDDRFMARFNFTGFSREHAQKIAKHDFLPMALKELDCDMSDTEQDKLVGEVISEFVEADALTSLRPIKDNVKLKAAASCQVDDSHQ